MKRLVLVALFLSFFKVVSAQNTINDMVIEQIMVDIGAYSYIGQMKQTPENIRTLDSLNVTMIIVKRRLPESSSWDYMDIDTLYLESGCVTAMIQFQNCYTATFDSLGRITEKRYTRTPNSPVEKLIQVKYDSYNFPIYSYVNDGGIVFERIFQPHYNNKGILDSIACSGNSVTAAYESFRQENYKNGDSIVVTKAYHDSWKEFIHNDYFVRTLHHDTVQVCYYQENIDQFQEYTYNYLNNLLVESYFESRGVYTDATTYNKLGLPKESFGTGVTNEGCGNMLTIYEYYSVPPGKKKKARLILME